MILDINPNLLICVQGLWNNTWFGENLELVGVLPLELKVKLFAFFFDCLLYILCTSISPLPPLFNTFFPFPGEEQTGVFSS